MKSVGATGSCNRAFGGAAAVLAFFRMLVGSIAVVAELCMRYTGNGANCLTDLTTQAPLRLVTRI